MKMKFLILGATGMAGHTILFYLKEQGHDVTAFSRKPLNGCKNIIGDVYDLVTLRKILEADFDCVVNCIGSLNQFAEEDKSNAVFLNSFLPHYLVKLTKSMNTKIIHLSTDCVFSGRFGNYVESDSSDGKSFYDKSKSLGEFNDNKNLTFRNSIIGPDMHINGIGLFNWFMQQNDKINGYRKAIWTGVTTLTLAKSVEKAAENKATGLYHLVNNKKINKYELLKLFNKYFKNNELEIKPFDGIKIDKSLMNTRVDYSFNIPSYEKMISEMREWIIKHKVLYPHYFMK